VTGRAPTPAVITRTSHGVMSAIDVKLLNQRAWKMVEMMEVGSE